MNSLVRRLFFIALVSPQAGPTATPPADVRAAITTHDRAVLIHEQWIRDPYIVRATDGWFYLTGTTLKNEPDHVIGIPIWRSRDLATWAQLPRLWSFAASRWMQNVKAPPPKQTGSDFKALGVGGLDILVWAPELHPVADRWIIVHTTNARAANLLLTSGPQLAPPLAEPMGAAFGTRHDPSLFVDGSTPWLIWGITQIAPLQPDFSGFAGPEVRIGPADRKLGHEGCTIRKVGRKYVLFGTAWSTDTLRHGTYNLYYCTADRITGPYGPRRFAGRFLGHGTPFQDQQDRWWCTAFYNANQPPITDDLATAKLADTAYTLNPQGTTIVPLDIRIGSDGDVRVRAKDPRYASPGGEEVQQFPL